MKSYLTESRQIECEAMEAVQCEKRKMLARKGHTCIEILDTSPSRTKWCGKDVCTNNKNMQREADSYKRDSEQSDLRRKLVKDGHTCVQILDTWPSKTSWCGEKICKNKKI